MSRISEFAVSRRSVTLLLAAALFIAGAYSWGSLKQELLPDIAFPVITVIAPYPGAGAADVTDQVTKPIERAISGVPRLERVQSTSANSIAVVVAQFSFGTDVKEARTSIEQNISSVGLPAGVTPQVSALDINASPVIIASLTVGGADGLAEAGQIARNDVVPSLQGLEGVASVDLTGGLEQRVVVTLDPAKLTEAGISVQQIDGVLTANNLTLPAGQLPTDGTSIPVSTTSRYTSLDQVRALVVGVKMPAATGASGAGGAAGSGTTPGGSTAAGSGTNPAAVLPLRSPSASSARSSSSASRRPAMPGRTASPRSRSASPRRPARTRWTSPTASPPRSTPPRLVTRVSPSRW